MKSEIKDELESLYEYLDYVSERYGEILTQYQSECALYGDAGPGQGITVRETGLEIARLEAEIAALESEVFTTLARFLKK